MIHSLMAKVPMNALTLIVMPQRLAICRLGPAEELPAAVLGAPFWSATHTAEELSLVIPENFVPEGYRCERGWRAFQVAGPLDLALTGVLSALASPLAQANISLFALPTFDTDYVLVRERDLDRAIVALSQAGHRFEWQE